MVQDQGWTGYQISQISGPASEPDTGYPARFQIHQIILSKQCLLSEKAGYPADRIVNLISGLIPDIKKRRISGPSLPKICITYQIFRISARDRLTSFMQGVLKNRQKLYKYRLRNELIKNLIALDISENQYCSTYN